MTPFDLLLCFLSFIPLHKFELYSFSRSTDIGVRILKLGVVRYLKFDP